MSPSQEALCCVPVLLLWLGPLALAACCLFFGGCVRLRTRLRPPARTASGLSADDAPVQLLQRTT